MKSKPTLTAKDKADLKQIFLWELREVKQSVRTLTVEVRRLRKELQEKTKV